MELTQKEKDKITKFIINHPQKSCAIVQEFIEGLQLVSASKYAKLKNKSKRTILYQSKKLLGIELEGRKYITYIQKL